MPALETRDLTQRAVLWPAQGYSDYGEAKVGAPVEVPVRWLWGQAEALDKDGGTVALDAQAVVDREVPVGSKMWLGTLEGWYATGSGGTDAMLLEVKTSSEALDLKGRFAGREVGLMRFRGRLPG